MFLMLTGFGNPEPNSQIRIERVFEHTEVANEVDFDPRTPDGRLRLSSLPALFLPEQGWAQGAPALVGHVSDIRIEGRDLHFRTSIDPAIPAFDVDEVFDLFRAPDSWARGRTHWALIDQDLFRRLLSLAPVRRINPRGFTLPDQVPVRRGVSVMMPFADEFGAVYGAIAQAATSVGRECVRADNIWNADHVIDDVVALIDNAEMVVLDCTGKNANVFFEMGVAHTLGQKTILITQSSADVPFDVAAIRHLKYLPNAKGLRDLSASLSERMRTLLQ